MTEPLPQRQRLHHLPPSWSKTGDVFFVTICCAERKTNSLAHPARFAILTSALEHYIVAEKLWVHRVLAMPDHLHALLAFTSAERMDKLFRDWKRFTAKQTDVCWQDGFFDHRLRHDESFEEKAHYIRMNPVRAGLCSNPSDWPYFWPR